MNPGRAWMYQRTVNGRVLSSFMEGVESFIAFAMTHTKCFSEGMMMFPYNQNKCQNSKYLPLATVMEHLKRKGFVADYFVWTFHGETPIPFMDYGNLLKHKRKKENVMGSTQLLHLMLIMIVNELIKWCMMLQVLSSWTPRSQ